MQKPLILGLAVVVVALCAAHLCPPQPEPVEETDSPAFGYLLSQAIEYLEHGTWEVTSATVGVANAEIQGLEPNSVDGVALVEEQHLVITSSEGDCMIAITRDICPITTDADDCGPVIRVVGAKGRGLEPDSSIGVVVGELEQQPMLTLSEPECHIAITRDICPITTDPDHCGPVIDIVSRGAKGQGAVNEVPEIVEEETGTDRTTWGQLKREFSD
jgi:hypothetical protein